MPRWLIRRSAWREYLIFIIWHFIVLVSLKHLPLKLFKKMTPQRQGHRRTIKQRRFFFASDDGNRTSFSSPGLDGREPLFFSVPTLCEQRFFRFPHTHGYPWCRSIAEDPTCKCPDRRAEPRTDTDNLDYAVSRR